MGTLCKTFLKVLDGLKPTIFEGEFSLSKKSYFFSKDNISALI